VTGTQELFDRHRRELADLDADLPLTFERALNDLPSPDSRAHAESQLQMWAQEGVVLATTSTQVAAAYFDATPRLLLRADFSAIAECKDLALTLNDRSPLVAAAFLLASPDFLAHRDAAALQAWVHQGSRFCRGTWKTAALAELFFAQSATLLQSLSAEEFDRLVVVLAKLSAHSTALASSCLEQANTLLASLAATERLDFLILADLVVTTTWSDTWHYFESGPDLLRSLAADQRGAFLQLVTQVSNVDTSSSPLPVLSETATAMAEVAEDEHAEIIQLAGRLADSDAAAAAEFLKSVPFLRKRISREALPEWLARGLQLSVQDRPAAAAFFRIETASAERLLGSLSGRVEFEREGSRLSLYATALGGEGMRLQPSNTLAERMIGWVSNDVATTDGCAVFVPAAIDQFGDQDANRNVYRVCIAHQAGRLTFGSFTYRYGQDGHYVKSTVTAREMELTDEPSGDRPSMQRFFDLFPERRLIGNLFAVVEDTRIDACIEAEYGGLRSWLGRLRDHEASERPELLALPLRGAFVENLVRASLGHSETVRWPEKGIQQMRRAVDALQVVTLDGAAVADSTEVAAWLYDVATSLSNFPARLLTKPWVPLPEKPTGGSMPDLASPAPTDAWWADETTVGALQLPDADPAQPFFRGSFKPELVQALTSLRADREAISREQLRRLLENSAEVEGQEADTDLLLDHIEADVDKSGESDADQPDGDRSADMPLDEDVEVALQWYYYDEWDFRANDYRPAWCHVGERPAREGEAAFYDETLQRYHGLVAVIRRQFELMRPETLRKLKRLEDGHEIELDQAIEFHADRKAGIGPLARFYNRRDKVERNVAVAFLLDMSASTEDEIFTQGTAQAHDGKRIIDLERESTVLVVEALQSIGDSYAIYGFSGRGRKDVAFHVIKELDQEFDEAVRKRIDAIEPLRATRMGAAIRHAQAKLVSYPAKVKILMLVSDGRPEDQGYGIDRSDVDYAVHDTKQALVEGKRAGIVPFLITVDKQGPDYLKEMCQDIGYTVVADVASLPERLPGIYRQLASR